MYFVTNGSERPKVTGNRLTAEQANNYVSFLETLKVGDTFLMPSERKGIRKSALMPQFLNDSQIQTEMTRMKNLVARRELGITLTFNMTNEGMVVTRKK